MSQDLFSATIEVLEKIAHGMGDADLNASFSALEQVAGTAGRGSDFERLQHHLTALRQVVSDTTLSDKGLNSLIETTHDLSNTLALNDLLRTVVTRARGLVGANIAWVTIMDEESRMFRLVTSEGFLSPATARMTSHVEYGAVSLVMKSKSFFDTQDYLHDQRFAHLPELDQMFRTESIVSLAGFPIRSDDKVHGLLFIADRYSRKMSGREISVLGSFALHAGVAMRNANAFKLLSEALEAAEHNRSALVAHIQRVETSAATHDEMTFLLASGAELQHFIQRMANQINGAVFLFDEDLRIQQEFTSEVYKGALANELRTGKFDPAHLINANAQSRHTGRSVVMPGVGDERSRAIALHGGTGRGESLVICHQGELDPIEIRNLERSTVALSIAKLWNEKRETERLIASTTLLRHLVLVTSPELSTLSAVRDRLNLRADQAVIVCLVTIAGLDRAAQTALVRDCAARTSLLVDLFDDAYVAIGPEENVRAFLANLGKRRGEWVAGGIVSEPFADLATTSSHFARMSRALQVLQKMGRIDRFVEQSEVNLFAKIFETGEAKRLADYTEQYLGPIDAKAPRQAQQLKQTLLCYFDSQYNLKRAADALGSHVNTVRQRLDTLRELTGGWDDPVRALELHIALRLETLFEKDRKS